MAGYTPVFDTIFQGSLCGKYPETAAWLFLLALADKNGVIDMTPHYIATVTGMPLDDLQRCIDEFLQPDPHSRTPDSDGRRLELLEADRDWGWRIVNHGKYREKARLQAKSAREVAEGKNQKRMRDRRRPPGTAADPPSNTNTNTNKKKGRARKRAPKDFTVSTAMYEWAASELGISAEQVNAETKAFLDHEFATAKKDWPATWRNWMRRAEKWDKRETRQSDRFDDKLAGLRSKAGLD